MELCGAHLNKFPLIKFRFNESDSVAVALDVTAEGRDVVPLDQASFSQEYRGGGGGIDEIKSQPSCTFIFSN